MRVTITIVFMLSGAGPEAPKQQPAPPPVVYHVVPHFDPRYGYKLECEPPPRPMPAKPARRSCSCDGTGYECTCGKGCPCPLRVIPAGD